MKGYWVMNLVSVFRDAFGARQAPPHVAAPDVPSARAIIRGIVSRYSEGNVSLQAGQYITEQDVARVMEELRNYHFKEPETR